MEQQSNAMMIHQYLMEISRNGDPVVLKNMITDWPAASWTPDNLQSVFENETLSFRIGDSHYSGIQWENKCSYESATVAEFHDWLMDKCQPNNPLQTYKRDGHWCYADYKYMAKLFATKPDILKMVDWSSFGFSGRDGTQSTFWLGSPGSYTVCHYDTYGCNLVAQIYGRKRWVLYPPSQTQCMYPTRIPYEESSVFSQVNIRSPDLHQHPKYRNVTSMIVVVEPGDVLFVPRHWWHYVESLDTSISINSWIELPEDDHERIREAVARTLAVGLMCDDFSIDLNDWLNPTEEATDHDSNMELIRTSLKTYYANRHKTGAARPHTKPDDSCQSQNTAPTCDTVQQISRVTFDELYHIFPCLETCGSGDQNAAEGFTDNSGQSHVVCSTAKISRLSTADIVRVLLQPAVLDSIVTELENSLVSESVNRDLRAVAESGHPIQSHRTV